ncbi:MAG: type II secretion system protein [bacterium]|nr:type II secretion system protein [bacterium]
MKGYGFTLAEVLITLAIIGVVAALTIPSVISNSQQQEFKTGLKKAVSVLNSAITINMAIDGESPYENTDLYNYLQRHMSVLKSGKLPYVSSYIREDGTSTSSGRNRAFYTTDGMRFEFEDNGGQTHMKLHESNTYACVATVNATEGTAHNSETGTDYKLHACGGCGSLGLTHNPNNTTKPPCALLVDVNGDRKPNPAKADNDYEYDSNGNMTNSGETMRNGAYKVASPGSKLIGDIFTILITEDRAIPYGVVAQKAMYEAQKY